MWWATGLSGVSRQCINARNGPMKLIKAKNFEHFEILLISIPWNLQNIFFNKNLKNFTLLYSLEYLNVSFKYANLCKLDEA